MAPTGLKFTAGSSWRMDLSAYRKKQQRKIPSSIAQLLNDDNIICGLLKEIYSHDHHDVEKVEVTLLTPCSDIKGNLSDSGRLKIFVKTYGGAQYSYNWFVKVQPLDHQNTELVSKFNVFKNEIEFYSKIAPSLMNFIKEANISNEDIQFDIPKMIFAEEDDDRAIIILEDLVSEGYKQERDANGNRYLSKEKAILAVESIAKIHAASYALHVKKNVDLGSNHPTLEKSGLLWTNSEMTSRLFAVKDVYCEFLKQSKNPDSPLLLERFRKTFDSEELLRQLCFDRCSSDEEGILCLQQGDFHFNNLLFKEEDGKLKVKIVDWQLTYNGRSGGDISYLLMSSVDPDEFEHEEENIKERYFHSFNDTFSALNSQDKTTGNKEENNNTVDEILEMEYDRSLQLGFFFSCGNVMHKENYEDEERKVSFTYQLCKEAADKNLI
eukprot:GFUD01088173.1.p1 GENE.GFUD01088173.1~~GFUD01088173.1.p1  ORF type:complete len:438 (+),score=117.14 GFUD01088173.1:328-1641(+)